MAFESILLPGPARTATVDPGPDPSSLRDLNLDQIIDAIVSAKEEYDLRPFFLQPLRDLDAIQYRHEVLRDLENPELFERIRLFASGMQDMRRHLATAEKLSYKENKEAWFLDAVDIYCGRVARLASDLAAASLESRGLVRLRAYLAAYTRSPRFVALQTETEALKGALSRIRYCLLIRNNRIRVRRYEGEREYTPDVIATFAKFQQGAAKDHVVPPSEMSGMNHVEAAVLSRVARLEPDTFSELAAYWQRQQSFADEKIVVFDREIQFYVSFLEYTMPLRRAGLAFCYPYVSRDSKEIEACGAYDLALAAKNVSDRKDVVCNDFHLRGAERIFVVSGPNQGGKTTFARMFGQMNYVASLGFPVPGRRSRLFSFDRIFTHFEREENLENFRGKLQDDLVRMDDIFKRATPDSIIVLNEIFTSTTLKDAIFLSRKILAKVIELDALCVCVTFIDELAALAEQTVSMVATVVPDNPAVRTFKIVRRPADGLAYAMAIAEKYGLKYDRLVARMAP